MGRRPLEEPHSISDGSSGGFSAARVIDASGSLMVPVHFIHERGSYFYFILFFSFAIVFQGQANGICPRADCIKVGVTSREGEKKKKKEEKGEARRGLGHALLQERFSKFACSVRLPVLLVVLAASVSRCP